MALSLIRSFDRSTLLATAEVVEDSTASVAHPKSGGVHLPCMGFGRPTWLLVSQLFQLSINILCISVPGEQGKSLRNLSVHKNLIFNLNWQSLSPQLFMLLEAVGQEL